MTDSGSPPPSQALRRLINGYQVSQAIHVAATLGIADELAAGPRTSDDLAEATAMHPRSLYRLLRALASAGVLEEKGERKFALTPLGECLRRDSPVPLRGWAAFIGRPYHWHAWADLLHSVRTGENAFRHVHGVDPWQYREREPEESQVFDRAMTDLTRASVRALLDAYDFGRFGVVVDVGGGRGALLADLLGEYQSVRGVLFDQPHVVAGAAEILAAAGVDDRCEVVGGDFFEAVPSGGDAYVLKAIVHDWEDGEALSILGSCRRAMTPGGALLVVERDLGLPNESPDAKFSDLNMFVAPGGQERTVDEYRALFETAGFRLVGVTPTSSGLGVIEGSPA